MSDADRSEIDAKISQLEKRIGKLNNHVNTLHDYVRQFSKEAIDAYEHLLKWKNTHTGQHNAEKGGRNVKEWKGQEDQLWFTDIGTEEQPTILPDAAAMKQTLAQDAQQQKELSGQQ